jgi:hypothetical protein
VYAILRAGRFKVRVKGVEKRIQKSFTHHQIMKQVNVYHEIFDLEFLENFKTIEFRLENDEYKEVLFTNMKYISWLKPYDVVPIIWFQKILMGRE